MISVTQLYRICCEGQLWFLVSPSTDITVTENKLGSILSCDPENFQTGEEYDPGTVVPLWRGVYYGLTVSHATYTNNNIVYNFRNWFETENFTSSTTFKIDDQTNEFRSMFQPTHPLTVSSYLEGGTSGNYQLTWQTPPVSQS